MSTALATVQEKPKSELVQQVMRYKNSLAKAREHTRRAGHVAVGQFCAAAGGATAGVLASKMPLIPKTAVPTDAALGVALGLGVALDMFDGANDYVNAFAMGLLGAAAARETQKILSKR